MRLAIGDVVRERADGVLGIVTGRADDGLVGIRMCGGMTRFSSPYDLEIVGRRARPMTTGHRIAALLVAAVGLGASGAAAHAVFLLDGSGPLTVTAAVGGYMTVHGAYAGVLHLIGPRRFRV
ncbi:hypothetical protein ACFVIM_13790 [Streptomyces sp. NPDC057638]|uniref:hypothetical protein n=1 Tax=Streptomyces sp. NPDC057638 TaxID=3346190 RepID=UPI0036B834AB